MFPEWIEEEAKANPQQIGTELYIQSVERLQRHSEALLHDVQRQRRRSTSGTLPKEEARNVRMVKGKWMLCQRKYGTFSRKRKLEMEHGPPVSTNSSRKFPMLEKKVGTFQEAFL